MLSSKEVVGIREWGKERRKKTQTERIVRKVMTEREREKGREGRCFYSQCFQFNYIFNVDVKEIIKIQIFSDRYRGFLPSEKWKIEKYWGWGLVGRAQGWKVCTEPWALELNRQPLVTKTYLSGPWTLRALFRGPT